MITETLGYVIKGPGLPGLAEIRIEPTDHNEYGVRIVLDDGTDKPRSYGLEELGLLLEALSRAHNLAGNLAREIEINDNTQADD